MQAPLSYFQTSVIIEQFCDKTWEVSSCHVVVEPLAPRVCPAQVEAPLGAARGGGVVEELALALTGGVAHKICIRKREKKLFIFVHILFRECCFLVQGNCKFNMKNETTFTKQAVSLVLFFGNIKHGNRHSPSHTVACVLPRVAFGAGERAELSAVGESEAEVLALPPSPSPLPEVREVLAAVQVPAELEALLGVGGGPGKENSDARDHSIKARHAPIRQEERRFALSVSKAQVLGNLACIDVVYIK